MTKSKNEYLFYTVFFFVKKLTFFSKKKTKQTNIATIRTKIIGGESPNCQQEPQIYYDAIKPCFAYVHETRCTASWLKLQFAKLADLSNVQWPQTTDCTDQMRGKIESFMEHTTKKDDLGVGRDVKDHRKPYDTLLLLSVEQIHNHTVWERYHEKRIKFLDALAIDDNSRCKIPYERDWMDLKYNSNEVMLWTGTNSGFVGSIIKQGIDPSVSCIYGTP